MPLYFYIRHFFSFESSFYFLKNIINCFIKVFKFLFKNIVSEALQYVVCCKNPQKNYNFQSYERIYI